MKKIIIDSYPLFGGHAIRGMGMYTKNLIDSIKNLKQSKYKISDVNLNKDSQKADLIHYPYFDLFTSTLPEIKSANRIVVTVPDVTPLIFPDKYPLGIRSKLLLNKNIKLLNSQADSVITISETSKKDIVRLLNYDPDKIFVTHLAPNFKFKKLNANSLQDYKKKFNLPEKFVLYVGDVGINKDVQTLAKACIKLKVNLYIVGKQASILDEFNSNTRGPRDLIRKLTNQKHPEVKHFEELKKLFESKYISTLGFVSDKDLNGLWNLATVYCQPSLYEGFGLGVVEAMQAGVPVVASKTQAIVEVAGDACIYFETSSVKDLIKKIKKVLDNKDLQKKLKSSGLDHVKKYTWNKTATETFKVYEKLLQ